MSVVILLMSVFYAFLFCVYGFPTRYVRVLKVRYDDICGDNFSCLVPFEIEEPIVGPLGLFYYLDGISQMRRELQSSFSSDMLQGKNVSIKKMKKACSPIVYANDEEDDRNILVPCGLLPHTVFTDRFEVIPQEGQTANFDDSNIALTVDQDKLFKAASSKYSEAVHWLEDTGYFPKGQANQHFMVWMRTSAFFPFRKLYATMPKDSVLEKGRYVMSIKNFYTSDVYSGKKYFIISEIGTLVLGTRRNHGPYLLFLIIFVALFIFALVLAWMGWRRDRHPKSPFHWRALNQVFQSSAK